MLHIYSKKNLTIFLPSLKQVGTDYRFKFSIENVNKESGNQLVAIKLIIMTKKFLGKGLEEYESKKIKVHSSKL